MPTISYHLIKGPAKACSMCLEILGLDPKITICKIAVLPIKLYPPLSRENKTLVSLDLHHTLLTRGLTKTLAICAIATAIAETNHGTKRHWGVKALKIK